SHYASSSLIGALFRHSFPEGSSGPSVEYSPCEVTGTATLDPVLETDLHAREVALTDLAGNLGVPAFGLLQHPSVVSGDLLRVILELDTCQPEASEFGTVETR